MSLTSTERGNRIRSRARVSSGLRSKDMPDVFTKKKRSEVMSRIRSRGNKETEITLMRLLRRHKISGWRRHAVIRGPDRSAVGKARPHPFPLPSVFASLRRDHAGAKGRGGQEKVKRLPPGLHRDARRALSNFSVRPDFVFRTARLALFVDGCYWHACPKHSNLPVNNRAFWRKKLAVNRNRDRLVNRTLRRLGWRVVRLWEHELRHPERCAAKIRRSLESQRD
jgi:DNA mismatch endonuclease (patch repair protein)